MDWYQTTFSEEQIQKGSVELLKKKFTQFFNCAARPEEMALFIENSPSTPKKETKNIYFSPVAAIHAKQLIEGYFAYPCLPPSESKIALLAGSSKAWKLLF